MRHTSALALALSVLVLSCTKDAQNAAGDVEQGAIATSARVATSGDLAKSIDDYTGAEFFSHVRGLQFTGQNERERRCRGCTGGRANARTRVTVDAVSDADSLGPSNIAEFGVVAVRARNRGNDIEAMYGMRSGARYEYYLIVLPGSPDGSARWRLEELEIRGSQYSRRQLAVGRIVECGHPFQRGAVADFRSCANAAEVRPASLSALFQAAGDDPLWYRCSAGCCILEEGGSA